MDVIHSTGLIGRSRIAVLMTALAVGACQTGTGGGTGDGTGTPSPSCAELGESCTDAGDCCDSTADCVDGTCQEDSGGGGGSGNVAAGQAIYDTDCMGCHAAPGAGGGFGPDLANTSAQDLQTGAQADGHPFDASGLAEEDFADLEAFLAEDDGGGGVEPASAFVGADTCLTCHASAHEAWSATEHATALEALEGIGQGENAGCLGCHTVGFGEDGGFVSREETPQLAGVQCENCHGAAAAHASDPGNLELRPAVNLSSTVCGGCHTDAHHPTFDEWELSKHSTALEGLRSNSFASDSCLECHSQDFRYATEEAEEHPEENIEIPTMETAQFSVECVTCHNPHRQAEAPHQLRMEVGALCGECHTSEGALPGGTPHHPQFEMVQGKGAFGEDDSDLLLPGPHTGLFATGGDGCAQCHVVAHEFEDPDDATPNVTGHTFNPFDEDITGLSPEHQAEAFAGCAMCHTTDGNAEMALNDVQGDIGPRLAALAGFFDAEDASYIDPDGLSEEDLARLDIAKFNYQFVDADGSVGVHNSDYANAALTVAEDITAALSGG